MFLISSLHVSTMHLSFSRLFYLPRAKGAEVTDVHLNPVKVLNMVEEYLSDNAILVADGGDFVGTAAYILRCVSSFLCLLIN